MIEEKNRNSLKTESALELNRLRHARARALGLVENSNPEQDADRDVEAFIKELRKGLQKIPSP